MHSHRPPNYKCPLCRIAQGDEAGAVVFNDGETIGVLTLHQKALNPGAVLVFPVEYFENIYSTPPQTTKQIFATARTLAVAMKKVFSCGGVTLLQNNEPAGGQDVWHIHTHVIPRFANDGWYETRATVMPLESRILLAKRIREGLNTK